MRNVYEMYYDNDKSFGFFIKRDSWDKCVAKVISIDGVKEGEDIPGWAPYFNNQKVYAEYYRVYSKEYCHKGIINNVREVRCAGTFAYKMI